jgi:hypothetical protein
VYSVVLIGFGDGHRTGKSALLIQIRGSARFAAAEHSCTARASAAGNIVEPATSAPWAKKLHREIMIYIPRAWPKS